MENNYNNQEDNNQEETSIERMQYEDPNLNCEPKLEEQDREPVQDNYNYNTNTGYNNTNYNELDNRPMTMGDWLLTILVMTILPCVGIPMYFVWAFGKNGNVNRRNYCRAYLIVMAISLALVIIASIVIGFSMIGSMDYYF